MNIGDVEKLTGLTAKTIRYYESRGLVQVRRKQNGYRTYDTDTVEQLCMIRRLRELDISLADIRLWCDNVVTWDELLRKRMKLLDDDGKKSESRKKLCEELLQKGLDTTDSSCECAFHEEETVESLPDCPLLLGIDIGTTSLSAQVIEAHSGRCVQTYSFDHCTALCIGGYPDAYAADAERLIGRGMALIASITETYKSIASIGIAGQMHGIICIDRDGEILSPLYTWQNEFGQRRPDGKTSICEEIDALCGETIPTGYGITTYYALRKLGLLPEKTARIVTVMDLLVARLTGTEPVLHPTNAAAIGAYDLTAGEFRQDVLHKLSIPHTLLPKVVGDYTVVGSYCTHHRAIPITAAIGDNQAGVYGAIADDHMVLINVGTSSQVSVICNDPTAAGGEVRPYFDGKYLLSGAALCGGRAYAMLKNFVRSITCGLGVDLCDCTIYEYLNHAASCNPGSDLLVDTRFCGTRTDPNLRGSITNIGLHNFTPEALSAGILRGMVSELYEMYIAMSPTDEEVFTVASGNAMRKNPALRRICAAFFGEMPLIPTHTEEVAFGAALYGGVSAGLLTREESYTRIHYSETKEEG